MVCAEEVVLNACGSKESTTVIKTKGRMLTNGVQSNAETNGHLEIKNSFLLSEIRFSLNRGEVFAEANRFGSCPGSSHSIVRRFQQWLP